MPEAIIAIKITTNNAATAVVALTTVGEFFSQTGSNQEYVGWIPDRRSLSVVVTGKSPLDPRSCKIVCPALVKYTSCDSSAYALSSRMEAWA